MLDGKSFGLVDVEHDDNALSFVNGLSDPILLMDLTGEIYAKNTAFLKNSNSLSLSQLPLAELSTLIQESFRYLCFPLSEKTPSCYSTITDSLGREHTLYLHPHLFSETHVVTLESYKNEDILERILDCIPARVFWKDRSGKFLGGNHLFLSDCGLESNEQLVGLTDYDFFPAEEADGFVADDEQVMLLGKSKLNIEEPQTRPDGEINWLKTSKVPIRGPHNDVIGVMGSYTDITERKNYQSLIEKQARQDQLTKLHNRLALQEYFTQWEDDKENCYGGLLFIDLDNFKTVNDTLGHAVGDALLKMVSGRITEVSNNSDFIVRLGGDEFAVLRMFEGGENKEEVIAQVNKLAEGIKQTILRPFLLESHDIQLGLSIGITYFNSGDIDWENTFHEADLAMYEAKISNKNGIKVFCEDIRSRHSRIYQMQTLLNQAIENNELYLNIQPQYDAEQRIVGAEALLRWNSKELGEVSPVEFIPLAEQSGSIHNIGMWVFEEAFTLVQEWSEKYGIENVPPLAVNLSAKQVQHPDFCKNLEVLLEKKPFERGLIHFELTESLLLESEVESIERLRKLSNLGFFLAIDDFGTGYSCLGYLNKLPIDKIKIDKSFTFQITEDSRQASIVETIISMAKSLNMKIIAEGVETEAQMQYLLQHGCFEFQGFYFSKPVSTQEYQGMFELQLNNINDY